MSSLTQLPFPPPGPGPAHRSPWEQLPTLMLGPVLPQGSPLLLPAVPRASAVPDGSRAPSGTLPVNILVPVGTPGRPAEPPLSQSLILAQHPLAWRAPGPLHGVGERPAPLILAAPPMKPLVSAPGVGPQVLEGSGLLGRHPPAPPTVVQMAPMVSHVTAGPQPHQACVEPGQPAPLAKVAPDDLGKHESVYENFRRWQRFKTLVRRHHPLTPDVEALSCFLIPVLRSLARLKPSMSLEEGLWRGLKEWKSTSNFDRMIFHEMAGKFMEFEAAEELENPRLELMREFQGRPPPSPPRLDPPRPPGPAVIQQPVCNPKKTGTKARAARPAAPRRPGPPESKAPREIPPEAVREYMDIMDWLGGPTPAATAALDRDWGEDGVEQQEDELYSDPGLLSYIDKLMSQEGFVTKVEAIINPWFMAAMLSPDPELDILALSEELEQEEGLSLDQLVGKRLLALKEEGGQGLLPSCAAPGLACSASESAACWAAERDDLGPRGAANADTCPPRMASRAHQGCVAPDALLPGRPGSPSLEATRTTPAQRGPRIRSLSLGSTGPAGLRGAFPAGGPRRPLAASNEDEEDLPSLAFLLASQHRLLPWELAQSPGPEAGLLCPGGRAPQPSPPQRSGLSPDPTSEAKAKKRPLVGDPGPVEKMPGPGLGPGVAAGQHVALALTRASQPHQRRCEALGALRRKKRH